MGRVTRAQRKATRSVSNSRTRHRKSLVVGTALPLRSIPEGAVVFNVEHRVGDRSVFATDPGDHAVVISHNPGNDTSRIKLSSGAEKTVAGGCSAILKARNYTNKGKRKSRRKGRVVAINPVEQPQGGDNQQQIGRNLSLIAVRSNSVQHRMDNWSMFRRDAPPGTHLVLITGPRISRRLRGQATSAAAAVNPNFD